ncbi:hypothetical protein ASPZODRAFT_14332 [Penicilliopsis zonata CBS 506.65]|uniref:Uncharacterized protein n=1 Tax=Penicilliopsis zonata CBS 506.65 TaxID=1073090 RepID=A0A1L9SM26_9EURO|nr:hypothetical protein ASPZODRAFT_14332 [Penicilliopsis zonata CBS 506.65]OJJ48183.1 hypothetical protein ASPZODRAFT_14332 [Penicilliopsis zonata CBS 506.65]
MEFDPGIIIAMGEFRILPREACSASAPYYVCEKSGFEGCCSTNPCTDGVCPDNASTTSASSKSTTRTSTSSTSTKSITSTSTSSTSTTSSTKSTTSTTLITTTASTSSLITGAVVNTFSFVSPTTIAEKTTTESTSQSASETSTQATLTTSSTATHSVSSSDTGTGSATSPHQMNKALVGGVAGGVAAAVIILMLLLLFYCRRRKRQARRSVTEKSDNGSSTQTTDGRWNRRTRDILSLFIPSYHSPEDVGRDAYVEANTTFISTDPASQAPVSITITPPDSTTRSIVVPVPTVVEKGDEKEEGYTASFAELPGVLGAASELSDTGLYRPRAELSTDSAGEMINGRRIPRIKVQEMDALANARTVVTSDGVVMGSNLDSLRSSREIRAGPVGKYEHVMSFMQYESLGVNGDEKRAGLGLR